MRTSLAAMAVGLSLVGCLVGDVGPSGTGDDDGPGGGSGSGSQMPKPEPALAFTVDKATMSTELLSTNMVTVTLTGSGGFSGDVALTASAVDAAGGVIPGWEVTLDKSTVTLAADGTQTAVATVKIPSESAAMLGTVKIEATSSVGAQSTKSDITVAKQLSVGMAVVGATCGVSNNKSLTVAVGTKVVWRNESTGRVTIHIQDGGGTQGINGFNHQPDPGMAPKGDAQGRDKFEQTANSAGTITWYCHAPGQDANRYTITAK